MSNNCQTEIVPIVITDSCGGDKKDVKCVVDTNIYAELGLEANSSQEDFNQAIYLAFVNLKAKVDDLEEQVNNL